jgi:hypothetical protein
VSNGSQDTRRTQRLLRWYPPAWRERYGEEFSEHLEQEFSDRPFDLRRGVNVAYKGLVARFDDMGLSNRTLNTGGQTRAALGTSFALITLLSVIALNYWSRAMLMWSARQYHPIPVDATTGILTVVTALLILTLLAIVLVVLVSSLRQIVGDRGGRIVWPFALAVFSAGYAYYTVRWLPRVLAQYSHMFQGGYRWTHPGSAAYALADISRGITQPWISMWSPGVNGGPTSQIVMRDFGPVAVLVFGAAMALLVRRVQLPGFVKRLGSVTVVFFGFLSAVFLLTDLVWFTVGGPNGEPPFWTMNNAAGIAYLVFMALVIILVARMGLLARKREPRRYGRNHIEIVGLPQDSI